MKLKNLDGVPRLKYYMKTLINPPTAHCQTFHFCEIENR